MSDARNSSNSVRGGGAKQTGGSGRTTKGARQMGGAKTRLGMESEAGDQKLDAKKQLQLKLMSKELANSVSEALLTMHTEAEFEKLNIPLPDPESAMRKLKKMKEFTMNWYDKDFREEWMLHVRELWENELLAQFEEALQAVQSAMGVGAKGANIETEGKAMSIEELQAEIENLNLSAEQRKKLKIKLKKKKQKQKQKQEKKPVVFD
eukprot:scaffold3310_cov283-Chaetoceros_neogracile.AAC.22